MVPPQLGALAPGDRARPASARGRRRSTLVALALGLAAFAPEPAAAEPEKRFGVGVVVTDDLPRGHARSGIKVRPLFRTRNDRGLHPAFGLNWVTLDLDADPSNAVAEGRLRLRPLLAGASYTWLTRMLSISPRVFGGYSFNRFRGPLGASAENGVVGKVEMQLWHDLSDRLGVVGSVGYLVARPKIGGRTVRADDLRLQIGMAYAVY